MASRKKSNKKPTNTDSMKSTDAKAEETEYQPILDELDEDVSLEIDETQPEEVVSDGEEIVLPQNIKCIGTDDKFDKKVYILQSVYQEIHKFAKSKTSVECGGVLMGNATEQFGKLHIVIDGFIEAKYSKGTATTLTFTHESWDYIHKMQEKKFSKSKIVGWIHTHPDYGIFLSEYDKFIQHNFFGESFQTAYVVDPIQNEEGFFFNLGTDIVKANCFYLYDKTGVAIETNRDFEPSVVNTDGGTVAVPTKTRRIMVAWISVLCLVCVILSIHAVWTSNKLDQLEKGYENMKTDLEAQNSTLEEVVSAVNMLYSMSLEESEVDTATDTTALATPTTETSDETASESTADEMEEGAE